MLATVLSNAVKDMLQRRGCSLEKTTPENVN
jgi:hypothetical protein